MTQVMAINPALSLVTTLLLGRKGGYLILAFCRTCMSKIRNAGISSLYIALFGQRMSNSATMIKTI